MIQSVSNMNSIYFIVLSISVFSSIRCTPQFHLSDVKLPQPMESHLAAIYNHTFTVFGGRHYPIISYITSSQSTSIYITLNDTKWTPNSITMPLSVSALYTEGDHNIRINEKLYIINPSTSVSIFNRQMFIYNLQTHQFIVSSTPTYTSVGACSVYNSKNNIIHIIGGSDGNAYQKYNQRFNISSNVWITPGSNTVNLKAWAGCSMDATNDHIFYFGGFAGSWILLDEIEKYTVSNDEWTLLSSTTLSSPRAIMKCRLLSTDNNIYCIGGWTASSAETYLALNIVDVFNPITEVLIITMYLNKPRYYPTVTLWNDNKCMIVSGGTNVTSALDSIETFGDCTAPTQSPSSAPSIHPSNSPTTPPTLHPSIAPSLHPSFTPSASPSQSPTFSPISAPSISPSKSPSKSPTKSPTKSPSKSPTISPSFSPTESPTIPPTFTPTTSCLDYNHEFSNHGDSISIEFKYLYEYATLNKPSESILIVSENNIECNNNNDCFIPCNNMGLLSYTCSSSTIEISNNTNKHVVVYCHDKYSCLDLSISVKSMVSMLNLTIICNADYSCINMNVLASNFNSMDLYCMRSSSCLDVNVNINRTNTGNNNETENDGIILCISENSCDHMIITTDSVETQLKMYSHSNDVMLDNKYGYIPYILFDEIEFEPNIVCNDKFIRYETSLVTQPIYKYVETSILNGYDI
eukprot:116806_1